MTPFKVQRAAPAALRAAVWVLACLAHPPALAAQDAPPQTEPPTAAAAVPEPERVPFPEWLKGVRDEALARGIRPATVDKAFEGLAPLPIVVERDKTQAEFTLSIEAYLDRRLTPKLLRDTRHAWHAHRAVIARVAREYGVPAPVLVAVWALESNLGRFAGVRPTIATLATLAWEGRRGAFFRGQLLDALQIVDRGDIELEHLKGSWAGAMGQVQFMPSSYLAYAVDFDKDGRRDIWESPADVFASIANYLREHGWTPGESWGREVRLPKDRSPLESAAARRSEGCRAEQDLSVPLPLERWKQLGVRSMSGGTLPEAAIDASLLANDSRSFLLYPNYGALLQYNCAHAYALSVGLLSDRLAAGGKQAAHTSTSTKPAPPAKGAPADARSKESGAPKKTRP